MQAAEGSESHQSSSNNQGNDAGGASNRRTPPPPPPPPPPHAAAPWVPMQYPTAAVVMQHGMMPHYAPPHYIPYPLHHIHHHLPSSPAPPPQQQVGSSNNGGGSSGDNRTLWVGDLYNWMDEDYLRNCFDSTRGVTSVKVIRNKQTGFSEGYGFVEFSSHATAEKVLKSYSSIVMPNSDQAFRLNWASFSMGDRRTNGCSDLSIFVGDLASDVTDALLHDTFATKYPSVKAAKVVIDSTTGRSKGYGFVRFGDDSEKTLALTEMNGVYCSSRPMRIGAATPRKSSGYQQQQYSSYGGYSNGGSVNGSQSDGGDTLNSTIFVGRLDPSVTDEDLRQPFSQYGEIVSIKIPPGRGCGFVQFANRGDAEEALKNLTGLTIGNQTVRLSWGRNPANKQSRSDYGNQWTGASYYGGGFYDPYGYSYMVPQSPGTYPSAYGAAYPIYGTHQQQVS